LLAAGTPPARAAAPDASVPARDQPSPRGARPGLAIGAGAGIGYAQLGAQLLYFFPLPARRLTLFGSAALGRLAVDDHPYDLAGAGAPVWGGALALGASLGRRHRLCTDVAYGAVSTQQIAIEGIAIDAVARYGISFETGYEFLSDIGFFARILPIGFSYLASPLVESKNRRGWNGSVGLGWKLW
jgi:hypothetical protein